MKKGPTVAEVQNAINISWADENDFKESHYVPSYASGSIVANNSRGQIRPIVKQTFVLGNEGDDVFACAVVNINGGGRICDVAGWRVPLYTEDAGFAKRLSGSVVGDKLPSGAVIVSVDGSPVVTVQEALTEREVRQQLVLASQKKQAEHEHPDSKTEEQVRHQRGPVADTDREERMADIAREKQREQQEASKIRKEAVEAKLKREIAEQKALLVQQEAFRVRQEAFRVQQAALRMQENLLRQQEEDKRQQERESQRRKHHFLTELTLREKRLGLDVSRLGKYPGLIHHAKQLTVEQGIQATFTVPELEYTPLLEIELNQAIEHEMQSLSAFREEAELLEDLAREQELQAAKRLQQEATAKQKQGAVDKYAAQYERSTEPLAYEKAVIQLKAINRYIDAGASSRIIRERATFLRTRCMNSRDAVPSTSAQTPASDGAGTKVGAIMGGIFGVIGGPLGIAMGAVVGGFIGNIADHGGDPATTSQASGEQKRWTALIGDIDELMSKLPE